VDDALVLLDDMKPVLIQTVPVLKRAADLSAALNHHLLDTLYHAVALEEGATLVTADAAYFVKAKHLGAIIPLGDFSIPGS
jgi:predicted nucleic acid-binding protein